MLAEHLNCPISSSKILLECLRERPGKDIAEFKKTIAMPFVRLEPISYSPNLVNFLFYIIV